MFKFEYCATRDTWTKSFSSADAIMKDIKLKVKPSAEFEAWRNLIKGAKSKAWANAKAKQEKPTDQECHSCKRIPDNRLKACFRCKKALYCNIVCQQKAWPGHRGQCKPISKTIKKKTIETIIIK